MPSQIFCTKYTKFLHTEFYTSSHISSKCSHINLIISNYHPTYSISSSSLLRLRTIIAVGDIPQQPPHSPLVVDNTDNDDTAGSDDDDNDNEDRDDNNDNNHDNDNDNSLDKGDDDEPTATSKAEDNESGSNQGVHGLRCRGKGVMQKYDNYSLLMAAR